MERPNVLSSSIALEILQNQMLDDGALLGASVFLYRMCGQRS